MEMGYWYANSETMRAVYVAMIIFIEKTARKRQGYAMKKITREYLKNMMDSDVDFVLIDARGHEAYAKEHLPRALSIPSDHLGEHLLREHKKDRTFVTYCSSFECEASTIAAQKLDKYGFKNVLEFKGGLEDWKKAGYPTEK
jgi:rhodanese-related sulfurtransferase